MILIPYLIILIFLSIFIGKKRGLKGIISLIINTIILLFSIVLINVGVNIFLVTYLSSLSIILIIIFYLNGINIKTKCSFISVVLVSLIMMFLIIYYNNKLHLGSFSYEFVGEISAYSFNIALDLNEISFMVLLFITCGTICDTSVAISSAVYEINNNASLSQKELYTSGMNVGKDIIGTTINTLLFSFIAQFLGYFLWHNHDKLINIINYQGFSSLVIELLIAMIGCLLIIPITALIESKILKDK